MTDFAQRRFKCLAAVALAGVLAGCATLGQGPSGKEELKTASDQTSAQKRAEIRLQLAAGYFEQANYPVALDEVKKAIAADPQNPNGYGLRAIIYMRMEEKELANDNFLQALKLAPTDPDLNNNYGSFLCQHDRIQESFKHFDTALANRNYQSPAGALNNAGNCALKIKNVDLAERYLLQALKLAPDVPETNIGLAKVYYARRDYPRSSFFMNQVSKTAKLDALPADVLWLGIKVQRKMGDEGAEQGFATQLRRHHADSAEFAAYQRGAFDE
ncbi:type IV pilus biogenesis/stability protein PilW [Pseudoduganella violaceinigra]|uniref:type IV pilus biogenesis/stability protein PilW n=1 Tax=Pseudoduganella violaceinigra TaxID=246602 RepID=UPI0004076814|nr:type IV pilus biogenesis/stability protein PilW [Pseudoduganella violaceinigra]